jgi:HEAT repeat protein
LTAVLRDASAPVRRAAAEALGSTPRNDEAVAALGGVVQGDAAYGPRASAIRSLGAILGVDAWGPVAEAMRQTSEREVVKIAAMETLRKIDPKRAAPILLEETAAGRPYESRERALSLLAQVAGDVKLKDALDDGTRSALSQALRAAAGSNHPRLRSSALRSLGQLDDAEGAAVLEKTARETRDGGDRRAAEDALAQRKARATRKEP